MADWGKPFSTSFRFMRVDRASGNEVERIMNIKNGGCIERNQDKDYTTGQIATRGFSISGQTFCACTSMPTSAGRPSVRRLAPS